MRSLRTTLTVAAALLVSIPAFASDALLRLVPKDATVVGMVRLNELRTSPLASKLFERTDDMTTDGEAARFLHEAGLDPREDVDTILVAVRPGRDDYHDGEILVAFEGRFDPSALGTAVVSRGATLAQSASGAYYRLPDDDEKKGVVAFVNRGLTLAGTEKAVVEALALQKSGGSLFTSASGLGRELSRVDRRATAWMLMDVPRSARLKGEANIAGRESHRAQQFEAALRHVSTVAVWAWDGENAVHFGGTALSADAETRQMIDDILRGMTSMWRMAAQEKSPRLVEELRKIKIEQSRDAVTLRGSVSADVVRSIVAKSAEKR